MKKEIIFKLLFLIVCAFPLIVYLHSGNFLTHDGEIHTARIHEYYVALLEGQIPVRIAPTLLGGAGYPLFVINYHLPYALGALVMVTGASQYTAMTILTVFAYVLFVLGAYLFFRKISSPNISMLVTLNLLYTPYFFTNLFVRGGLPEIMATTLLVWTLFVVVSAEKKEKSLVIIGLLLGLQLMTQTVVALISIPLVCLIYVIFNSKKMHIRLLELGACYLIGLLFAAFILFPVIFERHFFQFDTKTDQIISSHFIQLTNLLKIPGIFGSDSSWQLSFLQSIFLLGGVIAIPFMRNTKRFKQFMLMLIISWVFIYFLTPASIWWWQQSDILHAVLFPWRILTLISISSSIVIVFFLQTFPKSQFFVITMLILSIVMTRHFIRPVDFGVGFRQDKDQFITGTTDNEFTPVGALVDQKLIEVPQIDILDGAATILEFERNSKEWKVGVDVAEKAVIQAKVLYFPGWKLMIDGNLVPLSFPLKSFEGGYPGLPVFEETKGMHIIELHYEETPVRKTGNGISLLTLGILAYLLFMRQKRIWK